MDDTWTIGELAERAAGLLRAGGPNGNGRVREVPGERLIRWYTTIGLVDPPLSRRGRVARYGRRHLLQLVAVKRLQAAGLSIADIQVALAGATDAMLEAATHPDATLETAARPETAPPQTGRPDAAVPPAARLDGKAVSVSRPDGASSPGPTAGGGGSPEGEAARFWARTPRDLPPAPAIASTARQAAGEAAGGLVRGIRIAPGVTLVLDGAGRVPSTDDVQAVLGAAAPLLAVLEERKLA
ncbi:MULTISPECIES: MerR family transcriptional regulator [unclassified Nonomuraea]|uniref:helix-turn-helix domain-containing protein n=1 Tax=unclassified Nonomuraea TaxID=2593643 RepID=UPI0033F3242A